MNFKRLKYVYRTLIILNLCTSVFVYVGSIGLYKRIVNADTQSIRIANADGWGGKLPRKSFVKILFLSKQAKSTRLLNMHLVIIENILANADKIGGKTGKNIAEWGDKLLLAKELTTIRLDAPIIFTGLAALSVDTQKYSSGGYSVRRSNRSFA